MNGYEHLELNAQLTHAEIQHNLFDTPIDVHLGRYSVLRQIGRGGMGRVYEAYDPKLERPVALKLLYGVPDPELERARLTHEAQALARITSHNVIRVYDVDEHEGQVFLAMELVDGPSLDGWQAKGPHRWQEILSKYEQAGRGLAAAHEVGRVHRDFKPSNVLVGTDGRVCVVDFGLAREPVGPTAVSEPGAGSYHETPRMSGTKEYMAPEQAKGQRTDARSDQFSFCVALWEALFGVRPYDVQQLLEDANSGRPKLGKPRRGLPRHVHAALRRGLAFDASARWPSMGTLLLALDHRRVQRRRVFATLGGAVIAAGCLGLFLGQGEDDPCATPDPDLLGAWNADIEARLGAVVDGYEDARVTWEGTLEALRENHDRLLEASEQACRVEGTARAHFYAERCLKAKSEDIKAVTQVLLGLERKGLRKPEDIFQQSEQLKKADDIWERTIQPPDECLRFVDEPRTDEQTPPDPAVIQPLSVARALLAAGQSEQAARELDLLIGVELDPLTEAKIKLVRAEIARVEARYPDARQSAFEALRDVEREGEHLLGAKVRQFLVEMMVEDLDEIENAKDLLWAYEGIVEREKDPDAQVDFLNAKGLVALRDGRPGDAVRLHEKALALAERSDFFPSTSERRARAFRSALRMANAWGTDIEGVERSQNLDRAAEIYERLLEESIEVLEWRPFVIRIRFNLGVNAMKAQRFQDALLHFTRAYVDSVDVYGSEDPWVGKVSTMLSGTLCQLGNYEGAHRYARAAWRTYGGIPVRTNKERLNALRVLECPQLALKLYGDLQQTYVQLTEDLPADGGERHLVQHSMAWVLCHELLRCDDARPFIDAALPGFIPGTLDWLFALNTLAQVELAEGKTDRARAILQEVMEQAPRFGEAADALIAEAKEVQVRLPPIP